MLLPALFALALALTGVLPGCRSESRNIAPSELEQLALTEAEGSAVVSGFSLAQPIGVVSNDKFMESGPTGIPELDRRLVEEFKRQTGFHGEYSSATDESLSFIIEMDLYPSESEAKGALNAQLDALKNVTPTGLPLTGGKDEGIGEQSWGLTAKWEERWESDVVFFRRSNLVVAVAALTSPARDERKTARALAVMIDGKAVSASSGGE